MAAFDGFVLSSRTEGTPIALLEAMAAGIPTVATAVGGVPDVVSSREAWLVPSESPERLAGAIGELLASPTGAAERGRAARERLLQERGPGPWLDRHEALYRSLLDRDGRA
jgi:glycosyltransferase involved in cell wall biosynthesis